MRLGRRATRACSRSTTSTTARDSKPNRAALPARKRSASSPTTALAAGFLTGKYRSAEDGAKHPGRGERLKRYLDARGLRILKTLDTVAARHNALPAQIAIAWLIAKPIITAPIASATSRKQLEEIVKAPYIKLSSEDVAMLDAAGA